jgi:hypothetical protein
MSVAIVIPIYKNEMTLSECISIKQALKIFPENDIILVTYEGLNLENYFNISKQFKVELFDRPYFSNIGGYNKLMLSGKFYYRFLQYQYLLIYQLDAYVFKNQLNKWTSKDYDYVGAPWLIPPPISSNKKPKVNIQHWFVNKVGNGGLSLRKVKTHFWTALFFSPLLVFFPLNEDMFFGVLMDYLNPFYRKPEATEALQFAFEMNPTKSFELNNKQLPMGVHAWEKYEPEFWKPYIQ